MFFYLLRLFSTLFPLSAHRAVRTQCLGAAGWVCCLHSNHQEQRLICTVSEQGWGAVCAHVCLRHCLALQGCGRRELSRCKPQTTRNSHLAWLRAHRRWSLGPTGTIPSTGEWALLLSHAPPWHQGPAPWRQEVAAFLFKVLEKLWRSLILWYWCSMRKRRETPRM